MQAGGTLQEEMERSRGRLPGPLGPGRLLSSQAGPLPSKAPSRPHGSWGHRREAREIRRGRREEPSGRSGRGAEGVCSAHLGLRSLLGSQVRSLPSETRGGGHAWGPFCSLSLSPTPHSPQGWKSPKHRPRLPPKLHPCLGPALHSQGHPPLFFSSFFLFFFFLFLSLLLFFTIVILMYLLVVDSSIFLFLYSF